MNDTYSNEEMTNFIEEQFKLRSGAMTTEEFLAELNSITRNKVFVATPQVLQIYEIRVRFEGIVREQPYKEGTIRTQGRSGTLNRIDTETVRDLTGAAVERPAYYWTQEVLKAPLGRWYHSRSNVKPDKKKPVLA